MSEKPLDVRVAEALGWGTKFFEGKPRCATCHTQGHDGQWLGWGPDWGAEPADSIPSYDTDWSATGPLIERFEISVVRTAGCDSQRPEPGYGAFRDPSAFFRARDGDTASWSYVEGHDAEQPHGSGSTPLEAVCELILALSAAGKLPK